MKTGVLDGQASPAAIVRLAGDETTQGGQDAVAQEAERLVRARAFAEPLLMAQVLDSGEEALAHCEGTCAILESIGASPALLAAVYLVYASNYLQKPAEVVAKAFGESYASMVGLTHKLVQVQRQARSAQHDEAAQAEQTERVRKMLLAFSKDLRVVLLRLASRLQTLRHFAATKQPCPEHIAHEALQVFAPLANRLGIWQLKWELEDLAFRFLQPSEYKRIAKLLDEKRVEREAHVELFKRQLRDDLGAHGIVAEVQGRPKHIHSIWRKMQGKQLDFSQVFDVRAVRVIVHDVAACYGALAWLHEHYKALDQEFDDYIAKPKPNGYQSLHTVVMDERDRPIEVQIRTRAMHDHAEHGVAAHWAYKEAGTKGYAGVVAAGEFESQVAEARKSVLKQLLAWERDFAGQGGGLFDDRIFVFTPDAAIVELPQGATAVDFAYTLHTDLGHRCRGAKVDGALVTLNTPLRNGQTVEITSAKEGGPSLDWLNAELGFIRSNRARAKVRAWFNAVAMQQTMSRGRDAVEKLLQREGKTAVKLDDLAEAAGFKSADDLFVVVGKDEFSLKQLENLLRPPAEDGPSADERVMLRKRAQDPDAGKGGVLVVGVESLLTQLARCCRPVPPDDIAGYVTRGKGVAVHRRDCPNFRTMLSRAPERAIPVTWGVPEAGKAVYPVDVMVEAQDRSGLLRDITEVLAKEKMNVVGVSSQTVKAVAHMVFTLEVDDSGRLGRVLQQVAQVNGVRLARRR